MQPRPRSRAHLKPKFPRIKRILAKRKAPPNRSGQTTTTQPRTTS